MSELETYKHAYESALAEQDRLREELEGIKAVCHTAVALGLWPSPSALEAQQEAIKRGIGPILVCALPKSGSLYIRRALRESLSVPDVTIAVPESIVDQILLEGHVALLARGGMMSKQHASPSRRNIAMLKKHGITKIVVHMRDPRQAAVSWWHYAPQIGELSADEMTVPEREAYLWDTFFVPAVRWIGGWLKAADKLDILYTSHERMPGNEKALIGDILRFFGHPDVKVVLPPRDGSTHFRSGYKSEWREFFSCDFQTRASDLIPPQAVKRFGWPAT